MGAGGNDEYPGWIFRLNVPNSTDGDGNKSDSVDSIVEVEGLQLLPKEDAQLKSHAPIATRYLAELCPHGASVTIDNDYKSTKQSRLGKQVPVPGHHRNPKWSWSYSSQESHSPWNVTSANLLSVTYRPAREAYPSYTNISKKREYWHKSVGTCLSSGADCVCGKCLKCADPESKWGKMKRQIAGAPRLIHRVKVTYTVNDVISIEPITASQSLPPEVFNSATSHGKGTDIAPESGVWIRGIGQCHALRIHLRAKFGSLYNNGCESAEENESSGANCDFALPELERWDNIPPPEWGRSKPEDSGPVLTFAIPCQGNDDANVLHKCPPLLWKVDHPPNPEVAVDSFLLADGALHLHRQPFSSPAQYDYDSPTNVYIHGYQSWSFSGSVVQGKTQPKSAMPNILSAAFNRGGMVLSGDHAHGNDVDDDHWSENTKKQTYHSDNRKSEENELNESTAFYKSDMFACVSSNGVTSTQYDDERIVLDEEGGPALIIGFLAQRQQFGVVLLDKSLRRFSLYACHEGVVAKRSISSDWAYCQIVDASTYDEEAMVYYVHATGDHNEARPLDKGLTYGWCSWYHYYSDIDHDSLHKNVHVLESSKKSIGFNVCLIDDGYMTAWGDWTSLKPGKFVKDGGMRVLADTIRSKGMKPGVWLAPFACDKFSQLAKDHPDWIIYNDRGRYANSANCGKFFYGLDATNPAVRKHVYDTIRRAVDEWGFEVLKLDFLYASCLEGNGKYDPTMSRAEAIHLGLRTIRAAAGKDTFIIGCGCPIGSAIGVVDGMRISCDTGPTFVPEFPFPHWDNGTLPALRGMLRNTMSRSPFGHRWWHNDPDCILLGESTKLTDDEVISAASVVAMTGGMFLLSDDMEKVSAARLSIAKRIFPLTGVTAVPLDLHSTLNDGMPSILRLWCAETSAQNTAVVENDTQAMEISSKILGDQASRIECEVGYSLGINLNPYSRERSCFPVASGLGSWTVISISNWLDHAARLSVSFSALVAHSIDDFVAMGAPRTPRSLDSDSSSLGEMTEHGFHVFAFWSSEYVWIPHQTLVENDPLIKMLRPHETEIFHIKPADPQRPQYIGSDLHFSCGFEVDSFDWGDRYVKVLLKNDFHKEGSIFLYIPESEHLNNALVAVSGKPGFFEVAARPSMGGNCGGRVLRVYVEIEGSNSNEDGCVSIRW